MSSRGRILDSNNTKDFEALVTLMGSLIDLDSIVSRLVSAWNSG
jgi:hypothetical protein